MNREKSNSGIGLDLLANKEKTKKTSDSFFGTQNINLSGNDNGGNNDLGDLGDLGSLNDDDSYKFQVKDTMSPGGLKDENVNDLEKLNTYHSNFNQKKSEPLFRVTKSPENVNTLQIQVHMQQNKKLGIIVQIV